MSQLQATKKHTSSLASIVFSLALFFSGIFVLMTPVPLVYSLLKKKNRALWETCLPSFVFLFFLYFFGLEWLYQFSKDYPHFSQLLPIPGLNLLDFVPVHTVILFGLSYYLFYMALAILIAKSLSHPAQLSKVIGLGILAISLICSVSFVIFCHTRKIPAFDFLQGNYGLIIDSIMAHANENHLSTEQLVILQNNKASAIYYLALLSPTMLILSIAFMMILNLSVTQRFFAPVIPELKNIYLNRWKLDFSWVWIMIASVSALLLNSFYGHHFLVSFIGWNLLLALMILYFLQGIAIISFLLTKYRVPLFLRMIVYVLLILLIMASQTRGILLMVTGLGFFDSWFDLRKLSPAPPPANGG